MSETIFHRVRRLVVEGFANARVDRITAATHFADDLDADNMDVIQLVLAIEQEFDIDIPDPAISTLTTVESVEALVDSLLAAKEAA